jgi:DNA-binding PadR family transcriptional regulator
MARQTRALVRKSSPVLVASIERRIYVIRGLKVMLDADLAQLYRVPTSRLNEQVKRNRNRFPADFMFQLHSDEVEILISQNAISSSGHGGRRKPTYAFTEQGVAMLSSVLKSDRAVYVNIAIMRAFVKLREIIATHRELAEKIQALEKKFQKHDQQIEAVFGAIRELLEPSAPPAKRRIGFGT